MAIKLFNVDSMSTNSKLALNFMQAGRYALPSIFANYTHFDCKNN